MITKDQYWDYDMTPDGKVYAVNFATGEYSPADFVAVRPGSIVLTPEEQDRRRKFGQRMQEQHSKEIQALMKKRVRGEHLEKMKPYLYVSANDGTFEDISADTTARAAYLATFLRFGSDELWSSQRTRLARSKLPETMRLGKSVTDKFWREVNGRFFFRDDDGLLHTKGRAFVMGNLHADVNEQYQILCMSAYRELYERITPKQHKRLGYVLKMLPYINFEYNVLAYNPMETERSEIIPLTVADFCEAVGFDRIHARDLAKEYGKITFTVDGVQEVFCKFLSNGDDIGSAHIYANPRLIFKGSDPRKVGAIGISFAASAKPVRGATN